jgi:hypothetical protein
MPPTQKQGSNIQSVDLNEDGSVTIHGTITGVDDSSQVTLLHIWLAQPGVGKEGGVGLAIDALDEEHPHGADGKVALKPADESRCAAFDITSFGVSVRVGARAGVSASDSTDDAEFRPGPAVVSVIAVVSEIDSSGPRAEVLQWGRMLTLPERGYTEAGKLISSSQASLS